MKDSTSVQPPLWGPWLAWQELPEVVRQQALEVLTALALETIDTPNLENDTDDASAH